MPYSVVIPAYNAGLLIGETIRSVLAQTVPPQRIIVVDDGSSDDTAAVASEAGGTAVTIVRQSNAGPGAATTNGIGHIDTEIVATVDSDDLWLPAKMEKQLAILSDPSIGAVFSRIANFRDDPANAKLASAYDGWLRPTMVVRTTIARQVGPVIDPPGAGDMVDWIARLRETGTGIRMLPEVLVLRRMHAASMTARSLNSLAPGYLQVVRSAMLRRRAAKAGEGE